VQRVRLWQKSAASDYAARAVRKKRRRALRAPRKDAQRVYMKSAVMRSGVFDFDREYNVTRHEQEDDIFLCVIHHIYATAHRTRRHIDIVCTRYLAEDRDGT